MDIPRPDDADIEIATVLDEITAVSSKALRKLPKPRYSVPCSYFLESEPSTGSIERERSQRLDSSYVDLLSGQKTSSAYTRRRATFDSNYVESIAGHGIVYPDSDDSSGRLGLSNEIISLEAQEKSHSINMEEAEKFYGLYSFFQGKHSPVHHEPMVDIDEVLETAEENLTEKEFEDLQTSAKELDFIEAKETLIQDFPVSSEETGDDTPHWDLLKVRIKDIPKIGWMATEEDEQEIQPSEEEPIEAEKELEETEDIAEHFVDTILHSACIIHEAWERGSKHPSYVDMWADTKGQAMGVYKSDPEAVQQSEDVDKGIVSIPSTSKDDQTGQVQWPAPGKEETVATSTQPKMPIQIAEAEKIPEAEKKFNQPLVYQAHSLKAETVPLVKPFEIAHPPGMGNGKTSHIVPEKSTVKKIERDVKEAVAGIAESTATRHPRVYEPQMHDGETFPSGGTDQSAINKLFMYEEDVSSAKPPEVPDDQEPLSEAGQPETVAEENIPCTPPSGASGFPVVESRKTSPPAGTGQSTIRKPYLHQEDVESPTEQEVVSPAKQPRAVDWRTAFERVKADKADLVELVKKKSFVSGETGQSKDGEPSTYNKEAVSPAKQPRAIDWRTAFERVKADKADMAESSLSEETGQSTAYEKEVVSPAKQPRAVDWRTAFERVKADKADLAELVKQKSSLSEETGQSTAYEKEVVSPAKQPRAVDWRTAFERVKADEKFFSSREIGQKELEKEKAKAESASQSPQPRTAVVPEKETGKTIPPARTGQPQSTIYKPYICKEGVVSPAEEPSSSDPLPDVRKSPSSTGIGRPEKGIEENVPCAAGTSADSLSKQTESAKSYPPAGTGKPAISKPCMGIKGIASRAKQPSSACQPDHGKSPPSIEVKLPEKQDEENVPFPPSRPIKADWPSTETGKTFPPSRIDHSTIYKPFIRKKDVVSPTERAGGQSSAYKTGKDDGKPSHSTEIRPPEKLTEESAPHSALPREAGLPEIETEKTSTQKARQPIAGKPHMYRKDVFSPAMKASAVGQSNVHEAEDDKKSSPSKVGRQEKEKGEILSSGAQPRADGLLGMRSEKISSPAGTGRSVVHKPFVHGEDVISPTKQPQSVGQPISHEKGKDDRRSGQAGQPENVRYPPELKVAGLPETKPRPPAGTGGMSICIPYMDREDVPNTSGQPVAHGTGKDDRKSPWREVGLLVKGIKVYHPLQASQRTADLPEENGPPGGTDQSVSVSPMPDETEEEAATFARQLWGIDESFLPGQSSQWIMHEPDDSKDKALPSPPALSSAKSGADSKKEIPSHRESPVKSDQLKTVPSNARDLISTPLSWLGSETDSERDQMPFSPLAGKEEDVKEGPSARSQTKKMLHGVTFSSTTKGEFQKCLEDDGKHWTHLKKFEEDQKEQQAPIPSSSVDAQAARHQAGELLHGVTLSSHNQGTSQGTKTVGKGNEPKRHHWFHTKTFEKDKKTGWSSARHTIKHWKSCTCFRNPKTKE